MDHLWQRNDIPPKYLDGRNQYWFTPEDFFGRPGHLTVHDVRQMVASLPDDVPDSAVVYWNGRCGSVSWDMALVPAYGPTKPTAFRDTDGDPLD